MDDLQAQLTSVETEMVKREEDPHEDFNEQFQKRRRLQNALELENQALSEQRQQLLIEQETLKGTMKGLETMAHLTGQLSTARTSAETLTTELEDIVGPTFGVNGVLAGEVDRTRCRPKRSSDGFRRSFTGCPSITRTRTSSTACNRWRTTTQELSVATEVVSQVDALPEQTMRNNCRRKVRLTKRNSPIFKPPTKNA